jgi:UPF0271 protein
MMALEDDALARAIAEAVAAVRADLPIFTIKNSAMDRAATRLGLPVIAEFFADRPLNADGSVKMFDWNLQEVGGTPAAIAQRVTDLLNNGCVAKLGGGTATVIAETVCVHSDTPGSPDIARAIRAALTAANVEVRPPR